MSSGPALITAEAMRLNSLVNTFESFQLLPGTENAFFAFKALADGEHDLPFLLCYGGVGNGKTHLLEATIRGLNHRGVLCRYYTVADILRLLKQAINDDSMPDSEYLLDRFCSAPAPGNGRLGG